MIQFIEGDLLADISHYQAIGHSVNCQGVMPAEIPTSIAHRYRYTDLVSQYKQRCFWLPRPQGLQPGDCFLWRSNNPEFPHVFNLATQQHYGRYGDFVTGTRPEWITTALLSMKRQAENASIRQIALRRIRTGPGGLDWQQIRPILHSVFDDWNGSVTVYETYKPAQSDATWFTQEDILHQLDIGMFPSTENLYADYIDVRLSAYRDQTRWALIIEMLGVTDHEWCVHGGIHNWLYYWGNCLLGDTQRMDLICMTADGPEGPTFDSDEPLTLHRDAKTIRIRDRLVPIDCSAATLAAKGITLRNPPFVEAADLLRLLLNDNRFLLLATEAELRRRLPFDLPLILRLDEWHHPEHLSYDGRYDARYPDDQFPSLSRTFQMIADVLVTGNPSLYQPIEEPNTPTWID